MISLQMHRMMLQISIRYKNYFLGLVMLFSTILSHYAGNWATGLPCMVSTTRCAMNFENRLMSC